MNDPQIGSSLAPNETPERATAHVFISDRELLDTFVPPQMMAYFQAKLPAVGPDLLARRVCELLKYLMLVQFSPGRILFGKETDDLWHYWILQTKQYAELCQQLPGGVFRHHSSVDYGNADRPLERDDVASAVQRMLSFFISYYANFGPMTVDRVAIWPTLQRIMEEEGWEVDDLNEFLADRALASTRQFPRTQ